MVGAGRALPNQAGGHTAETGLGLLLWLPGPNRRRKLSCFLLDLSQLPELVSVLRTAVRTGLRNLKCFSWTLLRKGRQ